MPFVPQSVACVVIILCGFSPWGVGAADEGLPQVAKLGVAIASFGLAFRIALTARYSETARPWARLVGMGWWLLLLMPVAGALSVAADVGVALNPPVDAWEALMSDPELLGGMAAVYALIILQFVIFRQNLAVQFFGRDVPGE
jgi:hypothetical protein